MRPVFLRKSYLTDHRLRLTKAHHGTYLAEKLTQTLKEFGIEKKVSHTCLLGDRLSLSTQILGITADNASNNDTLTTELESSLRGANSIQTRVRCFAHILNLVVKVSFVWHTGI